MLICKAKKKRRKLIKGTDGTGFPHRMIGCANGWGWQVAESTDVCY